MIFGISRGRIPFTTVFKMRRGYVGRMWRHTLRHALGITCVYVVRHRDTVIYVGATRYSILERLPEHLYGKSQLGKTFRFDRPLYRDWTVEVFPMPDWPTALRSEKEIRDHLHPVINA